MTGRSEATSNLEWRDGSGYESYVGRWSRQVATAFVDWLDIRPRSRWLDVGCGTGALTAAVLSRADPVSIHGLDPAEEYVAAASASITDARASFSIGDATTLPVADASLDAVVSGLVLNFVDDAVLALAEQLRVVRPGGLSAAYVWDYVSGLDFISAFWQAAVVVEPSAADFERRADFPIATTGALDGLFNAAGLERVATEVFDVETTFESFDALWGPFLGATRLGHDEDPVWKGPSHELLISMDAATRERFRVEYRRRLPERADGTIGLGARALAIKAFRPN